jgi:hypothetical protein
LKKKVKKIKKLALEKPKMFLNDLVMIESFKDNDHLFFKVRSNSLVLFVGNDIEKTIKYCIDHCNRFDKKFSYNIDLKDCDFEKLIMVHLNYGLQKEIEYAIA